METKNNFYSVDAAALKLGICRGTLRNWLKSGKITTSYTVGKRPLFTSTEIEALQERIEQNPPKVGRPYGWRKYPVGEEHEAIFTS